MTDLPAEVTLHYNGQTFPVYSNSKISSQFVYDSAGRTVVATNYTLTVDAYFTADGDVGLDVETLRQRLSKPGADLYYRGNGFGELEVNATKADCRWGPKPKIMNWEPRGLENAVRVVWVVDFCLAECDAGDTGIPIGKPRPAMEYCYQVNYSLDLSGYTTVTQSGHVVIATTRKSVNDRTITDHADRLREQIVPRCPERFRVASQNFALSEDKTRLNFSVTFAQMPPNIPPAGVVRVTASHTMNTHPMAAVQWDGTIQATYELIYGDARQRCLRHFLDLVRDRIRHAGREAQLPAQPLGGRGGVGVVVGGAVAAALGRINMFGAVIPTRFSITENIYEREAATLSLSYKVTMPPGEIVRAIDILGFFRPPPGANDWKAWHDSVSPEGRPMHPRGVARMKFDPKADRIIDICLRTDAGASLAGPAGRPVVPVPPGFGPVRPGNLVDGLNGPGVELRPGNSWIDFRGRVRIESDDPLAEQPRLPTEPVTPQSRPAPRPGQAGGGYHSPFKDTPGSIIQYRGKPAMVVILEGKAIRAGYSIEPPTISRVGEVEAIPSNRLDIEFFESEVIGNLIYPICVARWRLRYILPEIPTKGIPPMDNPMYGGVVSDNVVTLKEGMF